MTRPAPGETDPELPVRPPDVESQLWEHISRIYHWYDAAAHRSRITYWALKLVTLASAGLVTVLAAADETGAVLAAPAALGLLAEGIQQTGQFHANYIAYRMIAETVHGRMWRFATQDQATPVPERERALRLLDDASEVVAAHNGAWAKRMRSSSSSA